MARQVTYHDVEQGTDEWFDVRRGIVTASELKMLLTPTLKIADNKDTKAHIYELAAQRISNHTEDTFFGEDMCRGVTDEVYARKEYGAQEGVSVAETGFVTRTIESDGVSATMGYSPDGLVGSDGCLEIKSKKQKLHIMTLTRWADNGEIPQEHVMQCQGALFVTGRTFIDLVSYCGGLPMVTMRVYRDERIQEAIGDVLIESEKRILSVIESYSRAKSRGVRLWPTKRREIKEFSLD